MDSVKSFLSFRGRLLPEGNAHIVGYAFLIERYDLPVCLPPKLSLISHRHRRYEISDWAIFTPRHQPEDNLAGHLTFALRYEGVNLEVLVSLFKIINPEIIARWVREQPTGRYSRRIWFLFERLTGKMLDVPDVTMGNYVEALDPKFQEVSLSPIPSRRHRVNNNFPGTIPLDASPGEKVQLGRGLCAHELTNQDAQLKAVIKEHFDIHDHEQDAQLKAVIKEHFDIHDHEVDELIHFMDQNFNRYETSRNTGV